MMFHLFTVFALVAVGNFQNAAKKIPTTVELKANSCKFGEKERQLGYYAMVHPKDKKRVSDGDTASFKCHGGMHQYKCNKGKWNPLDQSKKRCGCVHPKRKDIASPSNRVFMLLEGPPNGVSLKEFVSSPVNYSLSLYCSNGDVINGTNEGYCTEDGTWKPQVGRCPPENCKLSDLKEKRFFLAAKLTESDVNNTGIAAHGKTAKAVCCGHKYPDDSNQWPYTFTCQDGTWFPKTECNEDQYAFCNVKDLVEKKFFIAAERVGTGIKDTTYQTHGNNATAVCCGNKYPKDPNKWPYKFICQHGKWLPDIECNDEIDE